MTQQQQRDQLRPGIRALLVDPDSKDRWRIVDVLSMPYYVNAVHAVSMEPTGVQLVCGIRVPGTAALTYQGEVMTRVAAARHLIPLGDPDARRRGRLRIKTQRS